MKATKGKGNPAQVNELLRKKLVGEAVLHKPKWRSVCCAIFWHF